MAGTTALLNRIRRICLALPDTKETPTWGKPHFRVGEKIFAGFGEEGGRPTLGMKLVAGHAKLVVRDARFRPAPYVGHKGWVSMDVSGVDDWDEVAELVLESYRLIAPKRSLAKLEDGNPAAGAPKAKRAPAKTAPAKAAKTKAAKPKATKPATRGKRA